ncbi:MAG TPA: hypothetical protein VK207_05580 [Bacteroidales bacterium]|nr:hypothetical protein [Bacteroidales bacterium]
MLRLFFMFLIIVLFQGSCFSQETKLADIITSVAEELASDESDPEAIELYVERLSDLADDPVNLNSADESVLSRLFFLTDFQVKALADYTSSSGRIFSVYEVANIPGFNRETAEMIIPFISLGQKPLKEKHDTLFKNTLLTNFMYSSSSVDSTVMGSPLRILLKYKFTSGGFTGGFTMEKDPGEKIFQGTPPKPDFFSAHLSYTGHGLIRSIVIGDYTARFGQGTCLNTGWRSGLFLTSPGYMSSKNEVRPYTSTDENNFFRGAAASFALKDFTWTIFYSQNKSDATLNESGDHVINLYTAGLHNKPSLMLKKDLLTDMAYGLNMTCDLKNVRLGMVLTEDRMSIPFEVSAGEPESVYDFSGKRNSLFSFYYNSMVKKILLFGEATFNTGYKHAIVQGISVRLSDRLLVNCLVRDYEKSYYSFHGKGPGGNTVNETGILGNFTLEAARHLFVSAGCDLRNYPWLRFRTSSPSHSIRQEVRLKYLPENISIEALYNFRLSMNDAAAESGVPGIEELRSDYGRVSFRYSPAEALTFTTRIDYKSVKPSGDDGMLLSQDVSWSPGRFPVSLWFRYCLFSTESWDARLYAYENDLLYSFSIPALSGEGSRSYLMVKYKLKELAEVRVRYGITSTDEAGKEDLRVQVRLFF